MRLRVLLAVGGACGGAFGTALPLAGQTSLGTAEHFDSAARAAYVRDSSAGLSWVLPSHRDWSRYTHPAECVAAIELVQMTTMHRTNWTSPPVLDDTLSTVARNTGLACANKFTVANVSPHDWMAFLDLSLRLDKMALVHDIISDQLRRVSTADEKASVITDALMRFNRHTSAQVAMFDSLQQQMLALGPKVRWRRILTTTMTPKAPDFDTVRDTRVDHDVGVQWRALTHDDRVLAGFVMPQWGGSWYAIREFARADPAEICPIMHAEFQGVGTDTLGPNASVPLFTSVIENDCKDEVEPIGKPAAPVTGARWFRPGDTVGTEASYVPAPGRVTLVVNEPVSSGRPSPRLLMYARLAKEFGPRGLDVVLTQRRQGYLWGSGALSSEQETKVIRWYNHDYLKLPMTIAIYDSAATTIPRPMLVGKDGRNILGNVVLNSDWRDNEYVIRAFIEQALDTPAAIVPKHE